MNAVNPIQLQIVSTIHSDPSGEPEIIEQQLTGFIEKAGTEWKIRYKENADTSEEVSTMVRSGVDQLTIIRRGDISYRQVYRPGQVTESTLTTPGGIMEMEVRTNNYERKMEQDHGKIQFSFELWMNRQQLGTYQLAISWSEV